MLVTSVFLLAAQPSVAAEPPPAPADDGAAYLQRELRVARAELAAGRPAQAQRGVDKALSLVASATNPEAASAPVAAAVSQAMAILLDLGQAERAFGLYRATGNLVARALPAGSAEAVLYRLTEAEILAQTGDIAAADRALGAALADLPSAPIEPVERRRLLAGALAQHAMLAASRGDLAAAAQALRDSPHAAEYAAAGRRPASYEALAYLVARGFVAILGGQDDPVVAAALTGPLAFRPDPGAAGQVAVYRAAGLAFSLPPGPARLAALGDLRRRLQDDGARRAGLPGAWYRPGAIDQILIALALAQPAAGTGRAEADTAFALFQLAARAGPSFDADALTALGQASTELDRRAIHQTLRLRARRDRAERAQVRLVLLKALEAPATTDLLRHDPATRLMFRDFAERLGRTEASLGARGVTLAGANVAPLARFQASLRTDEAALAVTPTAGGYAYLCIRSDRALQSVAAADLLKVRLDGRLVQSALTATHAPSPELDRQFPMEAAARLYDALIRPFEPCLKPGDRILWLGGVAGAQVPLAALPSHAPPRVAGGYDLSQADWLVRRHAVAYAGAASVVVASRSGVARQAAAFDFLGVGDPVLTPEPDRARAAIRGSERFASLAPLPETRDELQASAQGFRAARLLLGAQATERGFRGELTGDYALLSFATHGLLRQDLEGLSEPALVLTPVRAADPLDDGLLTASEIADLDLHARFVALSACNTANFDLTQMAQDLPALASAFAVAGAPSTLATLWPVNSRTGRAVVAGVFERLRNDPTLDPAAALADAQRAFLAAPPSAAYLHPRFWAPFVALGDGGGSRRPHAEDLTVTGVERLTRAGGEVVALAREGDAVAARFISDADAQGRHGAAVRLARGDDEAWRRDDRAGGASRLLTSLGEAWVAGGYALGPAGRFVPTLESYNGQGQTLGAWRGDGVSPVDGFLMGAARRGDQAIFGVAELNLRDRTGAGGGRLHVLAVDWTLSPRPLFMAEAPAGAMITDATLTPMGPDILVTITAAGRFTGPPPSADDYDDAYCLPQPTTWLELRDGRTGAVKASRVLPGVVAVASTPAPGSGGGVLLGGSQSAACGDENHAVVVALDARLQPRTLYRDASVGASQVRTVAGLSGGRTFVAASKASVVDYRPPGLAPLRPDAYRPGALDRTFSGMVLVLARDGAATAPRFLDSGSNVYVTAAETGRPAEVLLGGGVGGEAAIVHLTVAP